MKDGVLEFETTHFSHYAIVSYEGEAPAPAPSKNADKISGAKTGDIAPLWKTAILLLLSSGN